MAATTRVAVVTGGNKGLGFGIVRELCKKFDGDVYLTSRDESRGKAAVDDLEKEGLHPKFHQLDILDNASIEHLRDFLVGKYGGLDVLVNNAAIAYKTAATEPVSQQAEDTIRTNYTANLNVCKILFPILRPHARVVNVSSSAGHLPMINGKEPGASELRKRLSADDLTEDELTGLMQDFVNSAAAGTHYEKGWPSSTYVVSKVGVSALSRIQQREFDKDPRPDLVVNHVHPGYVDTDMTSHKGVLTIDQGAAAPSYLALLPPNPPAELKGAYVWHDKQIVDWVNGPKPSAY